MSSRSVVNISKNHVSLRCASKPKISTNKGDELTTKGQFKKRNSFSVHNSANRRTATYYGQRQSFSV